MATYKQNINPKEKYQLILDITESFGEDYISTNKSSVTVVGTAKHNGDTVYSAVYGSSSNTVNINGTKYYPTTGYSMKNGSGTQIFKYTVPVEHNADGSKSITVSWSFTGGDTSSQWNPNGSISKTITLTTIPRATTLLNQSGTIGQTLKISWTKATKEFTHKLTYSLGTITDEVLGTDLVDDYTWNIPEKLYKEFINSPDAKGTLKLTTYNGTTQIGSTQEAELTIYANQTLSEPVIEDVLLKDINSATVALTGDNTTFVLNQSKVFLTLSFNTRNYATLKSLTVDGLNIDSSQINKGTQSQNGTTSYGLQYEYGTLTKKTINFVITDTRGFAISHLLTIHDSIIIDYVSLDAVVSFKRIAPTTGEVGLDFNGNYFNGSFGNTSNNLTISYKYKKSSETNYSSEFTLKKDTDYKISGNTYYSGNGSAKQTIKLAPSFDYKSQYDVQLTIKDKLTTLPTINVIITKGIPIMWWNGEKVTINGDLFIADENGENAVNVKDMSGGIKIIRWEGV